MMQFGTEVTSNLSKAIKTELLNNSLLLHYKNQFQACVTRLGLVVANSDSAISSRRSQAASTFARQFT